MSKNTIISAEEAGHADSAVSHWSLPPLAGKKIASAKKEKAARSKESVETVSRAARPRQLTAEEITQITREAEEEGYKAGYEEGFAKGEIQGEKKGKADGEAKAWKEHKARLENEISRLQSMVDGLYQPMAEQDQKLEDIVLQLVLHFASELLQAEIKNQPQYLHDQIKNVLQALPAGANNLQIYLHPDDIELLQTYLTEKSQNWPLQADSALTPGGCRVETRESIVDYSIEKRWQKVLREGSQQEEGNHQDGE